MPSSRRPGPARNPPRHSGGLRAAASAISATALPVTREIATGHSTAECPAFFRNRKNSPNAAPAAMPYPSPRSRPGCFDAPGSALTSTIAARQATAPAMTGAPGRSPPAIATPTGSTVETSADTGATTLIGALAKPA